jgi:addiction module HigA family antidote
MLPQNRVAVHPGEVLLREFLEPLHQTQKSLANHLGVPARHVNDLVRGRRGISPGTAWLLSQALGTSPEFWMNLQSNYDLSSSRPSKSVKRLVA